MPLPRGLPVVDHHCHLSPSGEGVAAARRFRAAGGAQLFVATQNYLVHVPRNLDDYRTQFETTETLVREVRAGAGVTAHAVVAPYPVDLVTLAGEVGVPSALDLHLRALDLAGRWVREHRAVALGEVGRAHFPVAPEIAEALETAFRYAIAVARESDCPVVVHSADLDAAGLRELSSLAEGAGLTTGRLVKHYARTRFPPGERGSVTPSYLARRELVRAVLPDAGPWFLETDFLDDPKRPGAVLDIATVPRRARQIAEQDPANADRLWVPFVESVEAVYGFRPEVSEEGSR